MKRPRERFRRWLEQAEHQLGVTDALLEGGFSSDVCLMAEQTTQMALKEFLYGSGRRAVLADSIYQLALDCAQTDKAFTAAAEWGKVLDRYYIATRYPDALAPPAVPFRSFTESAAQQARQYAADIVKLVKTRSEG